MEIEQLAREEGLTLPWPASVIAAMEERGQYVDLVSGLTGSDKERVSLTVVGEAAAVADRVWWDD